jgi:hypothetical protein
VASSDDTVAGQTSAELEYDAAGGSGEEDTEEPAEGDGDEGTGADEGQDPVDDEVGEPVFGFVGAPEVTDPAPGDETHRHTVRVRLTGVQDGDLVTFTLDDGGTWFCAEDCSPAGGQTRTVEVSGTESDADGRSVFVYVFDVWLPGNKSVSLNAELEGSEPSSSELVTTPKGSGRP